MKKLVDAIRQQAPSSITSSGSRLSFITEAAEAMSSVVDHDLGRPLVGVLAPVHATILRGLPGSLGLILRVLPLGQDAQVTSPAVQGVAVDVVNLKPITGDKLKQKSVQVDLLRVPAADRTAMRVFPIQRPAVAGDGVGIVGINDCVGPNRSIAGAQGDTNRIIGVHHEPPTRGAIPPAASNLRGGFAYSFYHKGLPGDTFPAPSRDKGAW
jgi:hypothetical protein